MVWLQGFIVNIVEKLLNLFCILVGRTFDTHVQGTVDVKALACLIAIVYMQNVPRTLGRLPFSMNVTDQTYSQVEDIIP